MALLKAFVCQLVLFGLYKLFLEQVVVDHLVPDELTRNCLVGFVIFICFGIQLYTDKAEDDLAENEDPETKSKQRESTGTKKFEPTAISVADDAGTKTVGSDASSYLMNAKEQTAPQEKSKEKQHSQIRQVIDLKEDNRVPPSAEEVTKNSHPGIFAEFSTNVPDKIDSAVKKSYESETKIFPLLNGFPEINASQESEEDGIEIDQFVCKAAEKLTTVDRDVYTTEPKHATDSVNESENLTSSAVNITSTEGFASDSMIDEPEQLITIKSKELHAIKPENVTEAAVESENLTSNGMKKSSSRDLNTDQMIDELEQMMEDKPINEEHLAETMVESKFAAANGVKISSKLDLDSKPVINEYGSRVINGAVMESSKSIDEMPSNINKENEINSTKDGTEVGDGNQIISTDASEVGTCSMDLKESLPSAQVIASTTSVSIKTVNKERTMNKNNVEKSTAVNKTVPSTGRKISGSENVNVSYYPVDISFIYACH